MKILLTNSPLQFYMVPVFMHADWDVLNLPQLAAMVWREHEVRIIDNWRGWFRQEMATKEARKFCPDIVGISNSTIADNDRAIQMARQIRQENKNALMITGGQAATTYYRDFLDSAFDIVVLGEGEYTFKEIVERFASGKRDFSNIAGLAYKDKGEYKITPPRSFEPNLDNFPFPAWELLPPRKSVMFRNTRASVIETSRGCPFGCDFCTVQSFWKRSLREKSNERIVAELKHLKFKLGVGQLYIIDDCFCLNVKKYTELFEMMLRENVTVKFFVQGIRPDIVANNPNMMRLAARAGLWGCLVGFDSYNEDELSNVGKTGGMNVNVRASNIMRKNGIVVHGVHMFGIPGFSPAGFEKTFQLGMRYSDTFRISRFSLIPGTPLFNKMAAEGQVLRMRELYLPYQNRIKEDPKKLKKMERLYFLYVFFGLLAIKEFIASRGNARRLKIRAYISSFRYVMYAFLRKVRLELL